MMRALQTAATGMYAQELYVDTIANNLANVNTTGFKKSQIEFQDLLYQTLRTAGAPTAQGIVSPTELQVGLGTRPVSVHKIFSQGAMSPTNNPLDLAIQGNGFFQILQPDGSIAYTRDGAFKLSSDGKIVTSTGLLLEPEISLPAETTEINIAADGKVSVVLAGETRPQEVGQIELVKFLNPTGLKSIGQNLYLATSASGEPILATPGTEGLGQLSQGFLEVSNVQVVEEMVNMIAAQRAYEINSKTIRIAEEMLSQATNLRR
ncbi:MAG: flagellar basal-body rod protein FlgG [candidate division KSB1 bacterium]|nr:flagellar basal-body rod protein FlgG [candidate division KSB1 bacterium]